MNTSTVPSNRLGAIALLALAFLVLFLFGLRTMSGPDIWVHLASGHHALEYGPARTDPFSFGLPSGTPWRQTTWLYDVLSVWAWTLGGAPLLILAHAAAVTGAFLLLIPVVRPLSNARHQTAALLLCTWILAPLFTVRPMLAALLFMAIFMNLLSRPRLTWLSALLLALTQLAWTNSHPSFLLGFLMAGAKAIEQVRAAKTDSPDRPVRGVPFGHLGLLAILGLASLVNPFGWAIWPETIRLFLRPEHGVVIEWISSFYPEFLPVRLTYFTIMALALIASVFIFRRERLPLLLTVCAAISAYFMVQSNHMLEVCALLAFPFLCMSLSTLSGLMAERIPAPARPTLDKAISAALGLAIAGTAGWVVTNRYYIHSGSAAAFGLKVNVDVIPFAALEAMQRAGLTPDPMVNLPQDGGYLLWRLPGRKVFTDPRGSLYGGLFFNRMAKALTGERDAVSGPPFLPETDAILLNATWPGARTATLHYMRDEQWSVGYFDGTSLLFLRNTSANRPLLENEDLAKQGLERIRSDWTRYQRALGHPVMRPPNPARLIGAASIYHVMGRFQESLALLEVITEGSPRMASAWINRGIAEAILKKTGPAIQTLEHASALTPSHPLPLLWLGVAYQQAGREADAAAARQRARAINAAFADRFDAEHTSLGPPPELTVPGYYSRP